MPHTSPPLRRDVASPRMDRPPMPWDTPLAFVPSSTSSTAPTTRSPGLASVQSPTRQRPKYRPAPVPPPIEPYPAPIMSPSYSRQDHRKPPYTSAHASTVSDHAFIDPQGVPQGVTPSRSASKYQPSPRPVRLPRQPLGSPNPAHTQRLVSSSTLHDPILPDPIPVPVAATPLARTKTPVAPLSTPKQVPASATYFVSPPTTPVQANSPAPTAYHQTDRDSRAAPSPAPVTPSSISSTQSLRRPKLLPAVSLTVESVSPRAQRPVQREQVSYDATSVDRACAAREESEAEARSPLNGREEEDDTGRDGDDEMPDLSVLRDRLPVLSPIPTSISASSSSSRRRRLSSTPAFPRIPGQRSATPSSPPPPTHQHKSPTHSPARPRRSSFRQQPQPQSPLPTLTSAYAPLSPISQVTQAPPSPAPSSVLIRAPTPTSTHNPDRHQTDRPETELRPPRSTYTRSPSPSDSISTITPSPTSTPRAPGRVDPPQMPHSAPPASARPEPMSQSHSQPMRKRDSTQRRLSALRGLVATLDFHNPWSVSEKSSSDSDSTGFVWACGGPSLETLNDVSELEEEDLEQVESDHTMSTSTTAGSSHVPSFSSISDSEGSIRSLRSLRSPMQLSSESSSTPLSPIGGDHGWDASPSQKMHTSPSVTSANEYPFPRLPTPSPSPSTSASPLPHLVSRATPSPVGRRRNRRGSDIYTPEPPRPSRQRTQTFDVASSGFSKSLLLQDDEGEDVTRSSPSNPITWRAAAGEEAYARAVASNGPLEVKRQEVIWELCETEVAFVTSMRTVLRLFATPLRTPQGNWISGIPPLVTELFDSLEHIVRAHSVLATAQKELRRQLSEASTSNGVGAIEVASFVRQTADWIHKLEVHEDYLVHFEPVVKLVEDNVRDADSVFGEFVRMQMKDEVLGSMSLGSMLLKPVQRLTKYPLFFKRLLDATPTTHASHTDMLSLLAATETIILRLQSAKAREEDFALLKSLESRLYNLPDNFSLAVRGRKLIGHGVVHRIVPGKDASPTTATAASASGMSTSSSVVGSARGRANSLHSSRGSFSSSVSSSAPSSWASSPWDYSPGLTPSTCRTSAFSVSSSGTSSQCGGGPPSRTNSLVHSSSSMSPVRASVARSPSAASSLADVHGHAYAHGQPSVSRPSTPSSLRKVTKQLHHRSDHETLTMLVFDDLVIVAQPVHEKTSLFSAKSKKGEKGDKGSHLHGGGVAQVQPMRVLSEHEGGVGKVVDVKDWSGWNGYSSLFSVTTITPSGMASTSAFTLPANSGHSGHGGNGGVSGSVNAPVMGNVNQFVATLVQAAAESRGWEASGQEGEGREVEELAV